MIAEPVRDLEAPQGRADNVRRATFAAGDLLPLERFVRQSARPVRILRRRAEDYVRGAEEHDEEDGLEYPVDES